MIKVIKNYFSKISDKFANENNGDNQKSVADLIKGMFNSLEPAEISIETGNDIFEYANLIKSVIFESRISVMNDTGFIFPPVLCTNNPNIQENEVIFTVKGEQVIDKFLIPNEENIKRELYLSFDELLSNHLSAIFTNELTEKYIDLVMKKNPKLIADISYYLSTVEIKYILTDLISNGKSIKNISSIFEKISAELYCGTTQKKKRIQNISENITKRL